MYRKLLYMAVLAVALCCCQDAYCKEGYRSMVLECSVPPGQQVRIQLDSDIEVNYTYGMMIISGRRVYVQVPLEHLLRWTFSKDDIDGVVGIDDAELAQADVQVGVNQAVVSGAQPGTEVALYDLSGICRMLRYVDDGECIVTFDSLSPGIYILKVGDITYKIGVR